MIKVSSMEAHKLARVYEKEVAPHWEGHFVPFLLESFPAELPRKATLLEMCCATGDLTAEIAARLPEGGRLIAVEDVRELMDLARAKIPADMRKRVFFKKEQPNALTFADETYQGVLSPGLPTVYDLADVLAEAVRLLGKDGFVLLGALLSGSFQELLDIYREVLEKEDLVAAQDNLDSFCGKLPDPPAANRMLSAAGLIECRARARTVSIHFENGLGLIRSPLVRRHCLEECLGFIKDRGWREGVLAGIVRSLDTYFPKGLDLTLVLGRLEGVKL
ncbi:MAG TPA: methyltransferase domain-containing protein [Myxococcota bacterium]|nr:methyltransferase domain-containing protein [Myxococcota bacterium]